MIPKGLYNKDFINSPFKMNSTALVEPQEGQGIPYIYFKVQTLRS